MSIKELSDYICIHKNGNSLQYVTDDRAIVMQHTRGVLFNHVHLTDDHIIECCEKACAYEEFIDLCRPLAITDTEEWQRFQRRPPAKGRTRRRFR